MFFRLKTLPHENQKPTFQLNARKFCSNFIKHVINFRQVDNYQMKQSFEDFSNNHIWKLTTMWERDDYLYQVFWQYAYNYETTTLSITAFLSKNCLLTNIVGSYNINLVINLFESYTKELHLEQQNYQFNINPISGVVKINSSVLIKAEQLQKFLTSFDYYSSLFNQLTRMIKLCKQISELDKYMNLQIPVCPRPQFNTNIKKKNNKKKVKEKKDMLSPTQFYKWICNSLKYADQNCNQTLQSFTEFSKWQKLRKQKVQFSYDIIKVIEIFKGPYEYPEQGRDISLSQVLNHIFDESYMNQTQIDSQKLVKKIRILSEPNSFEWKQFAKGGFGKLQKAFVKYEISDLNSKNKSIIDGFLVRKSDLKDNKIRHEKQIISLFKNDQHPHIMPQYVSDSDRFHLFSKYEPHLSLDRYLKVNKKTTSLQTIIRILQHIGKGLLYLQDKKIVHFDIKANNIIINNKLKAKITDFGQAIYVGSKKLEHNNIGFTIPYAPPEAFNHVSTSINSKIDVYSYGVTIFKVVFGEHIWGEIKDRNKFMKNLVAKEPQITQVPQKLFKQGVHELLSVVANLSMKSIKRNQQDRPSLLYLSSMFLLCKCYLISLVEGNYNLAEF